MNEEFDKRKGALLGAIDELSGVEARKYLAMFIVSLVTDTAGNTSDPFTYMWSRRFRELENSIHAESQTGG